MLGAVIMALVQAAVLRLDRGARARRRRQGSHRRRRRPSGQSALGDAGAPRLTMIPLLSRALPQHSTYAVLGFASDTVGNTLAVRFPAVGSSMTRWCARALPPA
jgi:hypothetical protein